MTAQLGCVRGAQAGVVWSVRMRVCGRICGEVCIVCVYVCVRVWSGCVVSGAGLGRACWRLGWEKSRCVYFTLGAVHGHGNTAQTPLYNTSMHSRTHTCTHNHKETKNIPSQVSCHTPPQTHCKLGNRSYNLIQTKWMISFFLKRQKKRKEKMLFHKTNKCINLQGASVDPQEISHLSAWVQPCNSEVKVNLWQHISPVGCFSFSWFSSNPDASGLQPQTQNLSLVMRLKDRFVFLGGWRSNSGLRPHLCGSWSDTAPLAKWCIRRPFY